MLTLEFNRESGFWSDFAESYWEQRPVVVPSDRVGEPFSLATVFDAVCRRAELQHADRFWAQTEDAAGNAVVHPLRWPFMKPTAADEGFAGYFRRMGGMRFGANIHTLEGEAPQFATVLAELAGGLGAHLQPQPLVWRTDVFFGTYPLTPFGIHRDPAGVLSVALLGTRSYHFWPPDCFAADDPDLFTPNAAIVTAHLDDAETLTVTAGQAVYWPSNRWHIVASDSEPFVSAQVSAYFSG